MNSFKRNRCITVSESGGKVEGSGDEVGSVGVVGAGVRVGVVGTGAGAVGCMGVCKVGVSLVR